MRLAAVAALLARAYQSSVVYPLDAAGALPLAAYGIKRLTASYSGPAVRIRRASDGVETDIGFSGQNIDASAVSAHLGAATGTVTTFYDLTGNGNHATQAVVANQGSINAILKLAGGLTVSLGDNGWYDLPAGVTIDRRNGEVCGVVEFWTTKAQAGLYEIGSVASANLNAFTLSTGAIRGTPPGSNAAFKPQTRPVWFDHYSASTGVYFEQDGESQTGTAVTSVTSSGGYFGRIVTSGYNGRFHHGMIAFYGRVLSSGERTALKAAADSIFSAVSTSGVLIYNGDSITASSTASTLRNGWAHQVTPLLSHNPRQFNFAGGGEQLVNDLVGGSSNFTTDEGAVLSRYLAGRRVVVVFKGTNDMGVGGRTPAQLYADLQSYCASVRSSGARVIVSTLLPRTSYGLSSAANFDLFNSDVRANWSTFADGFIDFANEPSMGASGAASNTSLYSDGLHPTAYGNSLLAAYAAPEINRVLSLPVDWTPAELTPALWLDAADASTITLNGSTVSQWRDKSGNGRHVAQATATKQPTYTLAAQNSLNVLSFDGNNRSLFASSGVINIPQPFSRFVAGQFLVKANQSILIDSDTNNTQCLFYNGEVGTNWVVANGIAPTFKSYSYGTRDFLSHQHSHIVNDAQSYWGIDGSSLTGPLDGGPGGQAGVRIGHVRTELSTNYAFNGRVFELVLVSGVISTVDRQKLEGYLAHKWGLTANLPSGHPYKLTPPTV